MRIVNLTKSRKQRLTLMLLDLVTEYSHVNIKRNNLIVEFKKNPFNIFEKKYKVSVDSLCISEIPKRLNKLAISNKIYFNLNYMITKINEIIYFNTSEHDDIIDYLWEEYLKLKGKNLTTLSSVNKKMIFEKEMDRPMYIRIFTSKTLSEKIINELQIKKIKQNWLNYILNIFNKKYFTANIKFAVR